MTRSDDALRLREHVVAVADAPARRLLDAYIKAWDAVRADLTAAARAAAAHAEDIGEPLNPAAYRTARLNASLAAIDGQLRDLARTASVEVTGRLPTSAAAAFAAQRAMADAAGYSLSLPTERALAEIVRRSTEWITHDFAQLPGAVQDHLRTSLLRGIAEGLGPRKVAAMIAGNARDGLGLGLSRSLVIARTELLDATREATKAMYLANSGVVSGWRWLASLNERTCPACWSLHNTVHRPDESLEGHQQCRCTQVPILHGDEPGDDDLGDPRAAFDGLPPHKQLAIMGPQRLAYLNDGGAWEALATWSKNPGWRPSYKVTPVRDLTLDSKARA